MTEKLNNSKANTTYVGEININDFNTNSPNRKRISNQIDANNFQELMKIKKKMRGITINI